MSSVSFFIMALYILSLNCNRIRAQSKRIGLMQWLRSLPVSVDIVCLQETHCLSSPECSSWFLSSGFNSSLSPGAVHCCGYIILFRPSLSLVNSWCDDEGRYLQCEFSFLGKSFRLCSIYAPNGNPARDQFLDNLHSKIDPLIPTVLCGDFNTVFNRSLDRLGSDPSDSSRESSSSLRYFFDACCTVDISRYLHPSSASFSWTRWDSPPALIFVVFRICGCLLFSLVTSFRVPSLINVVFSPLSPFPMSYPVVQVFGSSIPPFLRNRHMSSLLVTSGRCGGTPSSTFLLCQSGEMKVKVKSRVLPSVTVARDQLISLPTETF